MVTNCDTATPADGAKPNANGWHQEFDSCLEQVLGIQEAWSTPPPHKVEDVVE